MIVLIVVLVVIVGGLALVFRSLLGAEQNSGVTLGTNNPFPDGVGMFGAGSDEPPYLPNPVISDREEFLRDADRQLTALQRHKGHREAKSWMDQPGAMEAAGLADEPGPQGVEARTERG